MNNPPSGLGFLAIGAYLLTVGGNAHDDEQGVRALAIGRGVKRWKPGSQLKSVFSIPP